MTFVSVWLLLLQLKILSLLCEGRLKVPCLNLSGRIECLHLSAYIQCTIKMYFLSEVDEFEIIVILATKNCQNITFNYFKDYTVSIL